MPKATIHHKEGDLVLAVVKVKKQITSETKVPHIEVLSIHNWDLETLKGFTEVVMAVNLNEAQDIPMLDAGEVSKETMAILKDLKKETTEGEADEQ